MPNSFLANFVHKFIAEAWQMITSGEVLLGAIFGLFAYAYGVFSGVRSWNDSSIGIVTWAICGLCIVWVIKAAVVLHRDEIEKWDSYQPKVIGAAKPKRPTIRRGLATVVIFVSIFSYVIYLTRPLPVLTVRFEFKFSDLLTDGDRLQIEQDLNNFIMYLMEAGLLLPEETPPIAIVEESASGASVSGASLGQPTYYDEIRIGIGQINDQKEVVENYLAWAMMRLLPVELPTIPTGMNDADEAAQYVYQQVFSQWTINFVASTAFTRYFTDSFIGVRTDTGVDVADSLPQALSDAFWSIRTETGPEFTDRLVAFTVNAFVDDSRPNYERPLEDYFVDKIRLADRVIDSESSQLPIIMGALRTSGFLTEE